MTPTHSWIVSLGVRRPSLSGPAALLGLLGALAGCSPAGTQPASAFPPDTSASERQYGSALTVGLRVTTDPQSEDEPRVHIAAVVRDLDGVVETHELGDYEGTATQQPPEGDELVRVRVHHAQGSTLVVRITPDGHIEVHHQPDVGSGTTVRRIPLRDDATVVASDPPVEHTN
ncbi:MAG: hypothetical protein KC593_11820 [Myxococcales bacterium]|nr:hypothetical protein [Myxococcales bacterium]MCB9629431.1 hypothetical protein [Sandaracinaceae bacterium]